jgi:hypothetical protein
VGEEVNTYIVRLIGKGMLKIGHTDHINHRIDQLSVQHKCDLELICWFSDGAHSESSVHHRFRSIRIGNTELFQDAPEVAAWVASLHPMYRGSFTRKYVGPSWHGKHEAPPVVPRFTGFACSETEANAIGTRVPTVDECAAPYAWKICSLDGEVYYYYLRDSAVKIAQERGGDVTGVRWVPVASEEELYDHMA